MLLWNNTVDVIREAMFAYAQISNGSNAYGIITAGSMAAGPQLDAPAQQRQLLWVLPALFTMVALWKMAAGVGLYWGISSVFGIAQGIMVRRSVARRAA
jgi:membrane protein insertase Oxa1/YidC/SpoIIIJ